MRTSILALALASAALTTQANYQGEPDVKTCPSDFYQVPLFPEARLCQIFDGGLPATLSYHADANPTDAADFFVQHLGEPEKDQWIKQRRFLAYASGAKIIVISADADGSQVDLLVKAL